MPTQRVSTAFLARSIITLARRIAKATNEQTDVTLVRTYIAGARVDIAERYHLHLRPSASLVWILKRVTYLRIPHGAWKRKSGMVASGASTSAVRL